MPYSPTTWVDNVTPANAANLNNLESGVVAALTSSNGSDVIGYALNGSTDIGIYSPTHPVSVISNAGVTIKANNYWDGTNDRFISGAGVAYQLGVATGVGVVCKKSTNGSSTGAIITWSGGTSLYS